MTTKQKIEQNKAKLKQLTEEVKKIEEIMASKDEKKSIDYLLSCRKDELAERISRGEHENQQLQVIYTQEFEVLSAEANMKIEKLVGLAEKYIGKDPVGVTSNIGPLVDEYKAGITDQERRNEVYSELLGHYTFLTFKVKSK